MCRTFPDALQPVQPSRESSNEWPKPSKCILRRCARTATRFRSHRGSSWFRFRKNGAPGRPSMREDRIGALRHHSAALDSNSDGDRLKTRKQVISRARRGVSKPTLFETLNLRLDRHKASPTCLITLPFVRRPAPSALPKTVSTQDSVDPCLDIPAAGFPHNGRLRGLDRNPQTGIARRLMASIVEVRAHDAGSLSTRVHQHQCP